MKKKCAQIVADFMTQMGVQHVFTVTGGGAMHLNDAFGHKQELQCIYNHHEQACSIAAEGYARLTGRIACVCVTSGPGGTNAITGVLGGFQDSIPMFIVSGQVKRPTTVQWTSVNLRQLGDQEYQITESVANMTKYAAMVMRPEDILYQLQKAWFLANHGRKGPVWLDIPLDVQGAEIEEDGLREFSVKEYEKFVLEVEKEEMSQPSCKADYEFLQDCEQRKIARMPLLLAKDAPIIYDSCVKEVMAALSKAKRPVILAGTGIRLADSYEEFHQLIGILQIPVLTAWNAHDLLWENHPLDCGRPGTVGNRGGNLVLQSADLILVLACRLNIRMISYQWENFGKDAVKIVVDIDKNELCKPTTDPDISVHADVKEFMLHFIKELKEATDFRLGMQSDWLGKCRETAKKYPVVRKEYYNDKTLNPYVFIQQMFEQLPDNTDIVCSNGSACVMTFQAAVLKKGQRLFTNSGCAAMGYGFPASIGANFAKNGLHNTVCIDGDGSFQMNLQELQTVAYHKCNLKIVILNNHGYHSIRQTQTNLFRGRELVGVSEENGISFPEFERIADAYRIPYVRISNMEDTMEKLQRALKMEGPVLIEVMVDITQNFEPKLSSKVLPDGKIVSPPLDDMFPFLDREEYEGVLEYLRRS